MLFAPQQSARRSDEVTDVQSGYAVISGLRRRANPIHL